MVEIAVGQDGQLAEAHGGERPAIRTAPTPRGTFTFTVTGKNGSLSVVAPWERGAGDGTRTHDIHLGKLALYTAATSWPIPFDRECSATGRPHA